MAATDRGLIFWPSAFVKNFSAAFPISMDGDVHIHRPLTRACASFGPAQLAPHAVHFRHRALLASRSRDVPVELQKCRWPYDSQTAQPTRLDAGPACCQAPGARLGLHPKLAGQNRSPASLFEGLRGALLPRGLQHRSPRPFLHAIREESRPPAEKEFLSTLHLPPSRKRRYRWRAVRRSSGRRLSDE